MLYCGNKIWLYESYKPLHSVFIYAVSSSFFFFFLNWGCNYGVISVHAEGVMRNTLCLHKLTEMKPIMSENSVTVCNRPSVSLFVHCPHSPQCKYHCVLFVCLQPQVQLMSCLPRVMFPCCRRFASTLGSPFLSVLPSFPSLSCLCAHTNLKSSNHKYEKTSCTCRSRP